MSFAISSWSDCAAC